MIVVTGAAGHIGANLVRALLARGERVRAVVRQDRRGVAGLDLEVVEADITDRAAVSRALAGARLVYHLAARISIDGPQGGRVARVNVEGTRHVAEACLAEGAELVHTSSIHAFQQHPLDEPLDEQRARVPWQDHRFPAYDQSKAEGERVVRALVARGLKACVLHPTAVIGPHDHAGSRVGAALQGLVRRRLPALLPGGFNWVDVRDVVEALLAAPDRARTGESYLVPGTWRDLPDLARDVSAISGVAPPPFTTPMWLARATVPFALAAARLTGSEPLYTPESLLALQGNRDMRGDKLAAELGVRPRPLRRTLYDTLAWQAERGLLPPGVRLDPSAIDENGDY